jgi:DNA-binding MarR family transcriptional regulator
MRKAYISKNEAIRVSLVELRRLFQRKDMVQAWEASFGRRGRMDYAELRLLDAVDVAKAATIGEVARLLGVDQSRVSRQVTKAVDKGLLERRAAQTDSRKVLLAITPAGAKLQEKGSELTRARIGLAIAEWSKTERQQFATLLGRFVAGMTGESRSTSGYPATRISRCS